MKDLVPLIVPIAVCVVLPVAIVWLKVSQQKKQDALRAEVMLEAIRQGRDVDIDALARSMSNKSRRHTSPRRRLMNQLLCGCICSLIGMIFVVVGILDVIDNGSTDTLLVGGATTAVGISFLIVYFVGRKNLAAEEAWEKSQQNCDDITVQSID